MGMYDSGANGAACSILFHSNDWLVMCAPFRGSHLAYSTRCVELRDASNLILKKVERTQFIIFQGTYNRMCVLTFLPKLIFHTINL